MTNAELAVLSLIVEQPRHGYEIEQVIDERGMRDWTEVGFSSIYYLLKKLERNGFIISRLEQTAGRGPARKVYSVTDVGLAAWREATLQALSMPQPCYSVFQLGLASLPVFSTEEALAALGKYRQALAERHDYVQTRWREQGGENLPLPVSGMFELSITLIEAELAWLEQFIQRLANGAAPGGGP
ncbi:MAG: PadR family transcriptional regulator [Anaerolineae bacterium]